MYFIEKIIEEPLIDQIFGSAIIDKPLFIYQRPKYEYEITNYVTFNIYFRGDIGNLDILVVIHYQIIVEVRVKNIVKVI